MSAVALLIANWRLVLHVLVVAIGCALLIYGQHYVAAHPGKFALFVIAVGLIDCVLYLFRNLFPGATSGQSGPSSGAGITPLLLLLALMISLALQGQAVAVPVVAADLQCDTTMRNDVPSGSCCGLLKCSMRQRAGTVVQRVRAAVRRSTRHDRCYRKPLTLLRGCSARCPAK